MSVATRQVCETCGEAFVPERNRVGRFCSRACRSEANRYTAVPAKDTRRGETATIRRVIVPMCPPEELNPNARVHWRPYRRASGALRTAAKYAALEHGRSEPITGQVDVSIRVCWPRRRRELDADNALASCKAALDGLTDAGVWNDDRQMRRVSVEQEKLDKTGNITYPGGCIVVDIDPLEAAGPGGSGRVG